jgi:hypothetical protein
MSEKIVTNQITRLSTYYNYRVIWLVTIFSDITVMTRSGKAYQWIIFDIDNFAQNLRDILDCQFFTILRKFQKNAHLRLVQRTVVYGNRSTVAKSLSSEGQSVWNFVSFDRKTNKISRSGYFSSNCYSRLACHVTFENMKKQTDINLHDIFPYTCYQIFRCKFMSLVFNIFSDVLQHLCLKNISLRQAKTRMPLRIPGVSSRKNN